MIVAPPDVPAVIQTDIQALYQAAVADRLAGRPAEAVPKLEQVLARRPDDVDARLNLGLALLALDRLDEADAAFREVIARAPTYTDAHVGLARVAQRQGDLTAAREHADAAARLAPGDPAIAGLRATLAPAPLWRADVSASRSRLTEGLSDWTELRASVGKRLDDDWSVGAGVEITERFDNTDVYYEARVDRVFEGGSAYVTVGGAPDADYRAELAAAGGGQVRIAGPLSVTVDASVARYVTGTVSNLHPGVVLDVAEGRFQFAARWINVWDETGAYRDGYAVTGWWRPSDRMAFRLGYTDAPESTNGVTVEVQSVSIGAEFGLTDRILLRIGGLSEERVAYDREELSVGLGWRF